MVLDNPFYNRPNLLDFIYWGWPNVAVVFKDAREIDNFWMFADAFQDRLFRIYNEMRMPEDYDEWCPSADLEKKFFVEEEFKLFGVLPQSGKCALAISGECRIFSTSMPNTRSMYIFDQTFYGYKSWL